MTPANADQPTARTSPASTRNLVTLRNGQSVCSTSEAWRHECEARTVVQMPTREARRAHLDAVERLRGAKARQQLEETARALWAERGPTQRV